MHFSIASLFKNKSPAARIVTGWRAAVCYLCTAMMFLPMATLLPFNLLQQFRLVSEEEAHTVGETLAETREERRKPPTRPETRIWSGKSDGKCRGLSSGSSPAARGEIRFVNGTGAALLC